MNKIKNLTQVFFTTLFLLNVVTFMAFPVEGGGLLLLILAFWFAYQLSKKTQISIPKPLMIAIIVAAYLVFMQSLSYPIPASWFAVFTSYTVILFAVCLDMTLQNKDQRSLWENSLILMFFTLFILAIFDIILFYLRFFPTIQQLSVLKDKINIVFRLPGYFFIHPNVVAGFLNFIWPIILIRLVSTPDKMQKGLWFLALLLVGFLLTFTISRGAIVGAFLAGFYFLYRFITAQINQQNFGGIQKTSRRYIIPIGIGLILIIAILSTIIWRATKTGQFNISSILQANQILTIIDSLSSGRGRLWLSTWEAFLEKPFFGHGNASFPIAYAKAAHLPPGFLALSAHNLWLNIAVEYGLVGLIFTLVVLLLLIKKSLSYLYEFRLQPLQYSDAYLASFIAFLAHQIFDSMLWVSSYLVTLAVMMVFLIRFTLPFGKWQLKPKQFLGLSVLFVILPLSYSYFWVVSSIAPTFEYGSAVSSPHTHDLHQANLCSLADKFQQNALYGFECSMELIQQIFQKIPHQIDPINTEQALKYQESAFNLNPYWPPQQANLAVLYWATGRPNQALANMRQAAENAPKHPLIWVNLGWMEEQLGNTDQAIEAYDRAVRINPLLLQSDFVRLSNLFSTTKTNLEEWMRLEEKWDEWYEVETVDRDFRKAVISLGLNEPVAALQYLKSSQEKFRPFRLSFYTHLAYAQYLAGQDETAFQLASEVALLDQKDLSNLEDALLASFIGFILYDHAQYDSAYQLFKNSYILQTQPSEYMYYSHVYRQPIIQTDISPLLIRNLSILEPTRPGWEWFVEQASQRETSIVAEQIARWYKQLDGIALLEK